MRVVVVGAGIVGLATAHRVAQLRPGAEVVVVEKEDDVAAHQTGRNSGVVHAGIYYPPGSLKARLCRRGGALLADYCEAHDLAFARVGKVVVALDDAESRALDGLHERSLANGIADVRLIGPAELHELEPHAAGVRALHSPSTAIVDYVAVARALAADLRAAGGEVRTGTRVTGFREEAGGVRVLTDAGELTADEVVLCAGLHSAALARAAGDAADPVIVPFRGEYWRLADERAGLVRGLIYPVPDPRYPFLGVHLTRRIDGGVDVGPNAVLATALEGYTRGTFSRGEFAATLRAAGFAPLARQHWRTGVRELAGSLSRRVFAARARRYLPELRAADLRPAPAGVRAQAVDADGGLVDDFRITRRPRFTMVRNAPSPAATSALAIAEHVAGLVLDTPA